MKAESVAERAPYGAAILLLEDDQASANDMETGLEARGFHKIDIVDHLRTYSEQLNKATYEALSIDWVVEERDAGATALTKALQVKSPAGRVVYTGREETRKDALHFGADIFVTKPHTVEYLDAVTDAARLGFAREIARVLEPSQRVTEVTYPLSRAKETNICKTAFTQAVRERNVGRTELLDLLKRRGWISAADPFALMESTWAMRIRYYADLCNVTIAEIATVIRSDELDVEARLQETVPHWDDAIVNDMNQLLSVWSYALRLAGMHPELVGTYWTIDHLFHRPDTSPPWNETGMAGYLLATGSEGLAAAVRWIRSH